MLLLNPIKQHMLSSFIHKISNYFFVRFEAFIANKRKNELEKIISEIGIDKVRKSLREQYKPQSGFSPFFSTLEAIEKEWENFPELFWADVILELIFNSEIIYTEDTFNTQLNESYFTTQ